MPELTPSEKASLARQNAQCLLINNLPLVLQKTGLKAGLSRGGEKSKLTLGLEGYKTPGIDSSLQKVLCHLGQPDKLVNAVTADLSPPKAFIHATPAQLSQLQPRVDFYIRSNETEGGLSRNRDRKVIFSDYVTGERMTELQDARSGNSVLNPSGGNAGEGWNVGLKEFSWTYDNKHEGDKIVKANMIMYFGSLTELTNNYYLDFLFVTGRRTSAGSSDGETDQEKIKRLRDSVSKGVEGQHNAAMKALRSATAIHRDARQLKVIVGWASPPTQLPDLFETPADAKGFYEAIDNSQRTLLLNLTQYDINFNQNGSVEVALEYIASSDAFMVSAQADILADHSYRNDLGMVPTGRGGLGRAANTSGRLGEFFPDGYLYTTLAGALKGIWDAERTVVDEDGVERFGVVGSRILAEVEHLAELAELYSLTIGGNSAEEDKEKIRKNNLYLEAAEAVYAEYLSSAAANKYSSFLRKLINNHRCFHSFAKLEAIKVNANRSGTPPKYFKLETLAHADPSANGAHGRAGVAIETAARMKMDMLAATNIRAKTLGTTAQEYLDGDGKTGGLDGILNPNDSRKEVAAGWALEGYREILFVRLGDLIQVAADSCLMDPATQIVLGSFSPREARMRGFNDADLVCLAELPISLDYFGQWFFDHVISADRDTYPFRRFLDDLINDLINPILNELCSPQDTRLTVAYTNCTLSITDPKSPIVAGGIIGDKLVALAQQAADRASRAGKDKPLTTLILIHAEQVNDNRDGNRANDEKEGVYHFFLGADRGLVKEFNFSQKQMPQLRAMNIEKVNQGASKAGVLILPMDVSLRMVGNALLRNGSMIYVNADYGVGRRVADSLKLGGYYRVYKSVNTIKPGLFETTVECIFERPRINPAPKKKDRS
jgi:hypothetical protein